MIWGYPYFRKPPYISRSSKPCLSLAALERAPEAPGHPTEAVAGPWNGGIQLGQRMEVLWRVFMGNC